MIYLLFCLTAFAASEPPTPTTPISQEFDDSDDEGPEVRAEIRRRVQEFLDQDSDNDIELSVQSNVSDVPTVPVMRTPPPIQRHLTIIITDESQNGVQHSSTRFSTPYPRPRSQ